MTVTVYCPECGTGDAYCGLSGWSCLNQKCKHYKPSLASTKKQAPTIPAPAMPPVVASPPPPAPATTARGQTIVWANGLKTQVNSLLSQQLIANELLNYINIYVSESLIAGGAPRNWQENKLAKDIDVFLWGSELNQVAAIQSVLKTTLKSKIQFGPYSGSILEEVFETSWQGEQIQLIFVKQMGFPTLKDWVRATFDFDICKCYFEYGMLMTVTPEASDDFTNQTLTCHLAELKQFNRIDNLPERATKLQSYYPNHKIVISP